MEITKGLVIDFVMCHKGPAYPSEIADNLECDLKELIPLIKELVSEGKLVPAEGAE